MNTAKVAELLGISKSTLLRWIANGLIEDAKRNQKGWRVWSNEDIQKLKRFSRDYRGIIEDSSQSMSAQERFKSALSSSMLFEAKFNRFKNRRASANHAQGRKGKWLFDLMKKRTSKDAGPSQKQISIMMIISSCPEAPFANFCKLCLSSLFIKLP